MSDDLQNASAQKEPITGDFPVMPHTPPLRRLTHLLLPFAPIALALAAAAGVYVHRRMSAPTLPPPSLSDEKLVGTKAPDFSLRDAHAEDDAPPVTLSLAVDKGPVLLVFYFGYSCPRCIGHLGQIDGELDEFKKAGLQVMAISPWSLANTRDSIQTYGDFHFPLLSDPDNKVARAYGLLDDKGEPLHGVFIVDRDRRIQLAERTDHPFTDLDELLAVGKALQTQPSPPSSPPTTTTPQVPKLK